MGLWDVAARKYQALLADGDLAAEVKTKIALHLAECHVRDGNMADALALLATDQPAANHPDAQFWRAQALTGAGRFADAVSEFEAYLTLHGMPHRLEAAITSANLQLSLNNGSGALRTLASFADKANPQDAAMANLHRAAILLDSGYPEDAREFLPEDETIPAAALPLARYTRARLLLADGQAEEATSLFAGLLEDPVGQSIAIHHGAAIGLADAIHASTGPEAASRSLVGLLTRNPNTPLLDAAFRRLLQWLPENPTPGDFILEKLAEWIPQPATPATGLIPTGDSALAVWPNIVIMDEITAFAMFTRAVGLHRIDSPISHHQARILMARLRLDFPNHYLARRSLLIESRWLMEAGDKTKSLHLLALAADTSRTATTRGEAVFLEALTRATEDEGNASITLFEEASSLLEVEYAEAARFNAALIRILQNQEINTEQAEIAANMRSSLILERALSKNEPADALAALESFLRDHPQHPRIAEARLASAELALLVRPPDLSLARAQIDTLATQNGIASIPNAESRSSLIRLRIAELAPDESEVEKAIDIARRIIAENPDKPVATEAALTLGRMLFNTGDFNEARITFERLATTNAGKTDADPAITQAAYLLAARAAALGATTQSREEALRLFDNAITVDNSTLSGVATLEKARLLIDLNRLQPAIDLLSATRETLDSADPIHLPVGILLGEAIYAKDSGDGQSLLKALAIYDEMLAQSTEHHPTLYHRLQYLRGITLEKLPRADAPHLMRYAEAIEAYYSVIQRAGDQPPAEWEWFERCGFAALTLLEKAERWQAAINLARKIAAFNGPRAADAAEHAKQLQLKHMVWED